MSLVDNFLAVYGTNVFLGQSGEHGNGGSQELGGVQDMMKYHQVQPARKPDGRPNLVPKLHTPFIIQKRNRKAN